MVDDNIQWTSWGSNVYALADDGASIWVGGVGSAIRYDKADQTYKRYVPKQVKTHQHIYAVTVTQRVIDGLAATQDSAVLTLPKNGNTTTRRTAGASTNRWWSVLP